MSRRPSPAMIVAVVALLAALTGTATAASVLITKSSQIKNGVISFNEEDSPFSWVDLFGAGPATVISWTNRRATGPGRVPARGARRGGRPAHRS